MGELGSRRGFGVSKGWENRARRWGQAQLGAGSELALGQGSTVWRGPSEPGCQGPSDPHQPSVSHHKNQGHPPRHPARHLSTQPTIASTHSPSPHRSPHCCQDDQPSPQHPVHCPHTGSSATGAVEQSWLCHLAIQAQP